LLLLLEAALLCPLLHQQHLVRWRLAQQQLALRMQQSQGSLGSSHLLLLLPRHASGFV
jgi:hypothetical protein